VILLYPSVFRGDRLQGQEQELEQRLSWLKGSSSFVGVDTFGGPSTALRSAQDDTFRESHRDYEAIRLVGLDVFGADSHADESGEEAAEEWVRGKDAEDEGWLDWGWVAEGL